MNRRAYVALCSFLSAMVMFDFGYITMYPNTAFDSFQRFENRSYHDRTHGPDHHEEEWISETFFTWSWSAVVNAYLLGFAGGSYFINLLTDRYGRIHTILMATVVNLTAGFLSLISIPFMLPELLAIGRAISGIGNGLSAGALTLFLQETSPTSVRGTVSSLQGLMLLIPALLATTVGMNEILGNYLVYLVSISVIPGVLLISLLVCLHDTPKHLLLNENNEKAALRSLRFYQGPEADEALFLQSAIEESEQSDDQLITWKLIWDTPHLRKGALLGITAFLLQQFSGIWTIFLYATDYFTHIGLTYLTAELGSVAMVVFNIVANFISLFLVERVGRRPLILWTEAAVILTLSAYVILAELWKVYQTVYLSYSCLLVIFAHQIAFSLGPGPLPWFLSSELVPLHVRSKVLGFSLFLSYFVLLIITFVSLPMYDWIGSFSYIPLFMIPSASLTAYFYFHLPETRNQEISTIVNKLIRETSSPNG